MQSHDPDTDAALGITRCAQCGQKLDGEIECPVCTGYYENERKPRRWPLWITLTTGALVALGLIYTAYRLIMA